MSYLNADQEESLREGHHQVGLGVKRWTDILRLGEEWVAASVAIGFGSGEDAFRHADKARVKFEKAVERLRRDTEGCQPRRGSAVKAPTPCEKEGHNYQLAHFDFPWARVFCSRCGKTASLKW